jgi:hypothetical protein
VPSRVRATEGSRLFTRRPWVGAAPAQGGTGGLFPYPVPFAHFWNERRNEQGKNREKVKDQKKTKRCPWPVEIPAALPISGGELGRWKLEGMILAPGGPRGPLKGGCYGRMVALSPKQSDFSGASRFQVLG